jgi:flagellar motor switch protein FliN/FliY
MSTTALPQVETSQAAASSETPGDALVTSPQSLEPELFISPHALAGRLPVEVDVAIPLRGFRVRNLLALDTGTVVASQWVQGEDVPLGSGDVQLAWSEFEVVDTKLAVRLTRLV